MAEVRILLLLMISFVFVNCAVLRGKAFYCRDPDTGKLYAVNTTWSSSSFCGNYTCKLRKRNTTLNEDTPIRQLNVINIDDHSINNQNITIEKKVESDILPLLHKNGVPDSRNMIIEDESKPQRKINDNVPINPLEKNEKYKPKSHNCKTESRYSKSFEEGDRYLTEKEIDNIAELLHTVKKSDLDAIVDIYNLAQDIYKEMEKATDKELVNEAINMIQEEERHRNKGHKPASYWFNTLDHKEKLSDRNDMIFQSTRVVHSTAKPKSRGITFFNGALTTNDFGKVPYYYPISQFQRTSSYTHTPAKPTNILKTNTEFDKKNLTDSRYKNNNDDRPINGGPKPQKLIQPSRLLPYPFTDIHHYSFNDSSHFYHTKSPWILDYYNRHRYYQPYYNAYIAPIHKAILVNPHLSNEVQVTEQKPVKVIIKKQPLNDLHEKNKVLPPWKTKPISIEVLKDIRADIDSTRLVKAFPLRKKIKLERAGKLINVDELTSHINRRKRMVDNESAEEKRSTEHDEYETYLEKVTCKDQVEPGYFRVGNMSQPFPNCCPQMINTR